MHAFGISADIKSVPGWDTKKEIMNLTFGPNKAMAILKDKVAINNKVARIARNALKKHLTDIFIGSGKTHIKFVYNTGINFHKRQDEDEQ